MKNKILSLVLKQFTLMWALTGVGLFIGSLLPPTIIFPISILTIILLIVVFFVRSVSFINIIVYILPILIGITLFWTTQFYIEQLGSTLVFGVLIGTILVFVLLGLIGMMIPDISAIGNYLLVTLLVLIIFSILFMFFPIGNTVLLVLAGIAVLLFSLYTVYDFNQIRHGYVREREVSLMALSLYLDFINLFVNILQFISRLRN